MCCASCTWRGQRKQSCSLCTQNSAPGMPKRLTPGTPSAPQPVRSALDRATRNQLLAVRDSLERTGKCSAHCTFLACDQRARRAAACDVPAPRAALCTAPCDLACMVAVLERCSVSRSPRWPTHSNGPCHPGAIRSLGRHIDHTALGSTRASREHPICSVAGRRSSSARSATLRLAWRTRRPPQPLGQSPAGVVRRTARRGGQRSGCAKKRL